MRAGSREYVASNVGTEPLEVQRRLWQLEDALKELATRKRISTFGRALYSEREIENEALDPRRVLAISGGQLPVLFLNITFWVGEVVAEDLADIESRFGLHLLGVTEEPA